MLGVLRQAHDAQPDEQLDDAAFIAGTMTEVWRLVTALTDAQTAPDLVQETYLRALRVLPLCRDRAEAQAQVLATARLVCAEHVRTLVQERRLHRRVAMAADPGAPCGPGHDSWPDLLDLMDRLAPLERAAFVFTQLLGYSYAEAARIAQVPQGAIRARVARARAALVEMCRPVEPRRAARSRTSK